MHPMCWSCQVSLTHFAYRRQTRIVKNYHLKPYSFGHQLYTHGLYTPKPKPIMTHSRTFSRALRQLHVFASSLIGSLKCLGRL